MVADADGRCTMQEEVKVEVGVKDKGVRGVICAIRESLWALVCSL